MIKKLLSLLAISISCSITWGQTYTVYQNDFEGASSAWINSFSTGPNEWIWNDCAGNGNSLPGTKSQYITAGGTTEDCTPTGKYRYAYESALSTIGGAISQIEIDASCTGSMQISFDYKIEGVLGEDYVELVYSLDGGSNFTPIGAPLAISSNWTTQSISLPALLNSTVFRIGFRFIYNDNPVTSNPPAFDNILITGSDIVNPTINFCPTTVGYPLDNSCNAVLGSLISEVVASDNCTSVGDLTITQSPLAGTINYTTPGQTQLVTMTVTDLAGNSSQCIITTQGVDNTNPIVSCPASADVFLNPSCEASVPDLTSLITWSDNCNSDPMLMNFQQTPAAGTIVDASQTIDYMIIDPTGNSSSCSTTLNVIDNTAPVLTCPADESIIVNPACAINLEDYLSEVIVTENCFFSNPVNLIQSPAAGTLLTVSSIITITGEDEAGNVGTCTFTITPIDNVNPDVTCPSSITVASGTNCLYNLADYSSSLTITDNCTAIFNMAISQTPTIGTELNSGTHVINMIVEDESGNSSSCSFTIEVEDQTGPTITCSGNVDLVVNNNCNATIGDYSGSVTTSDNCSSLGAISISQSPAANTVIDENTQIVITATDEAGNASTCNFFAITIDNSDPVLVCPTDVDVAINSSCQYLVPDLTTVVTGTDNCSVISNMTLTQNPVAGSTDGGLTAVLITLTDEQGNQETCVTLLIPEDIEAPTVTCPTPATVNNGTNCDFVLPNYGASTLVLDNCSDYTITQNPPFGATVQTGSTLIEIEVSDVAGNMVACSFTLIVNETVAPTITCPSTISSCDPLVTFADPIVNDNCEAILTQIDVTGLTSGSVFPVGTTVLTYEVSDPSGNTQTCSFNVVVLDYPAQANIILDTMGLCNATSTVVSAEAHTTGTGEWTVISGQGNFNNQFANTTGINNLDYGTNILVYEISTVSCGSTSDTLYVIASQQPLPASTQDTLIGCNTTEITLLSNTPLYGTGVWTTTDVNASITDEASSNTTATNLSSGWNQFIWTITNGSCPSTSDTLNTFITAIASIDQADTNFCLEDGSVTLSASAPEIGQTSYWMFTIGSGHFEDPTASTTTVSDLNLGVNKIVYVMEYPLCASTSDTITIVSSLCEGFDPIFPTVITPNFDGKNDLFVINYLEKIYPECSVVIFNRWGSIVYESVGYEEPWDGTHNGEPLPMGTYFYKILLNDSANTVYNGPISIIR
jgi:gliding motility-associated-like protein